MAVRSKPRDKNSYCGGLCTRRIPAASFMERTRHAIRFMIMQHEVYIYESHQHAPAARCDVNRIEPVETLRLPIFGSPGFDEFNTRFNVVAPFTTFKKTK